MKSKKLLKTCSWFLAFIFTVTTVDAGAFARAESIPQAFVAPEPLLAGLPSEICGIEETWVMPQTPLVILLEEAHANYGAQKSIVSTLEHFEKKLRALGGTDELTIALEGSPPEEIDPILFRAFPVPEITRDVSNSFMWEGKIDGAEFYAINSNRKARLFGIDDKALYEENVAAYQRYRIHQAEALEQLSRLGRELGRLKEKVYAKPLKDLEASQQRLAKDAGTLGLHLALLEQSAKSKNLALEKFPRVYEMKRLFDPEATLSQKALAEKIRSVKSVEFFGELADLEEILSDQLAYSRDEKILVSADRFTALLEKLASLSLTQSEFGELEKSWTRIQESSTWRLLDDLFRRRAVAFKSQDVIREMLGKLRDAREFYAIAKRRDDVLVRNLGKLMARTGQKIIFVVAGGFHTEGITSRLRSQGISYSALLPKPDLEAENSKYWNLLAKKGAVKPANLEGDPHFQTHVVVAQVLALAASLGVEDQNRHQQLLSAVEAYLSQLMSRRTERGVPGAIALLQRLRVYLEANPPGENDPFVFPFRFKGYDYGIQEGRLTITKVPVAQAQAGIETVAIPPRKPPTPAMQDLAPELQEFAIAFQNAVEAVEVGGKIHNVEYVGKGAMGMVFRGVEKIGETGERVVAIKTLQPGGLRDPDMKKRLQREAVAMARVESLIGGKGLRIHKLAEVEIEAYGACPYYVMEFLPGPNLQSLLNESPAGIDVNLAVNLAYQAALQLHEIHRSGVIHRDIKPPNIALRPVRPEMQLALTPVRIHIGQIRGDFVPLIVDFGLAKIKLDEASDETQRTSLTQYGEILGTPVFMSPEQADTDRSRNIKPEDPRPDIYSLGATLFCLITGQFPVPPNQGLIKLLQVLTDPTEHSEAIEESLKLLDGRIQDPAQLNDLKKIFGLALAGDRDARYPTALALAKDLKRFLDKEKVVAERNISLWKKIKVKFRRNKLLLAAAFLGVLAFGGFAYFRHEENERIARDQRLQEERDRNIEAARAKIREAVVAMLGRKIQEALDRLSEAEGLVHGLNSGLDPEIEGLRDAARALNASAPQAVQDVARDGNIPELVRCVARIRAARLEMASDSPDFARAARNLAEFNRVWQALSPEAKSQISGEWLEEWSGAARQFLLRIGQAPNLSEETVGEAIEIGRFYVDTLSFNQSSEMEKAGIRICVARLLSGRDGAASRAEFELAVGHLARVTGAQSEEALWLKAGLESELGLFEDSDRTLASFQNRFPDSPYLADSYFLAVQNLMDWGIGQRLDRARSLFEEARTRLSVLQGLERYRNDNFIQMQIRKAEGDISLVEAAMIWSSISDIAPGRLDPTLSEERLDQLRRARRLYQEVLSMSPAIQEPDAQLMSAQVQFALALIEELKLSPESNVANRGRGVEDIRSRYEIALSASSGIENPPSMERWAPFEAAARIASGGRAPGNGQRSRIIRAFGDFAEALVRRRQAVTGGRRDPQAREFFGSAAEALQGEKGDGGVRMIRNLSSILSREGVMGRSLGVGGKIFDAVKEERRLSSVFMKFSWKVLWQIVDEGNDPRQRNRSPLIFLVPDARTERRIRKGYPHLWEDYRIGLLVERRGSMASMKRKEVEELLRSNQFKVLLASLFPEGEIASLRPEQVVFLNDSFGESWGEGVRRVKYDRERFERDEDYRAAYLTSAFYLVNHREGRDLFRFNQEDQTLELLPQVLSELVHAWQALKQVLVSA